MALAAALWIGEKVGKISLFSLSDVLVLVFGFGGFPVPPVMMTFLEMRSIVFYQPTYPGNPTPEEESVCVCLSSATWTGVSLDTASSFS